MNNSQSDRALSTQPRVGGSGGLAASRAWRILLLIAFVVQCTLVQSHVHPAEAGSLAEVAAPHGVAHQAQRLSSAPRIAAPGDCLLCWEQAMAGHYVLPVVAAPPPLPVFATWVVVQAMPEFGLRPSAHGWLSRAPPE